jgi:hypothetical protein
VLINNDRDSLINCADWTVLRETGHGVGMAQRRQEVKRGDRPGIDPRTAQRSAAVLLIN